MKVNSSLSRGLVAVAIAGSCGYVNAATIETPAGAALTAARYTDAAVNAASATADLATPSVYVKLAAAYTAGNAITLTLQSGQFSGNAANVATGLNCSSAATNSSDMVLAYQSGGISGSTSVTYLVQSVSAGVTTSGLNCSFGPRHLLTRSLSTTSGTSSDISFSAKTDSTSSGTAIDNAVATAALARAASQFSFGSVSGVSGQIDVTTGRILFSGAPTQKPHAPEIQANATGALADRTADSIQFRTGSISLAASTSAAQQTFEVSLTGDFSFADDTGGECSGTDLSAGAGLITAQSSYNGAATANASGRLSISTNCQTLTYKVLPADVQAASEGNISAANAPARVMYHTISLARATNSTGNAFAVGSYGYTAPVFGTFGTTVMGAGVAASTTGAGTFTSNGLVVDVPYMPFGNIGSTAVGHVFVWNNKSTQSASLSVTASKTGATSGSPSTSCAANTNLVTINANSIQNISDVVRNYVQGCFPADYTATGGPRVSLRFEANLPAASNELYSSFTVGSDRAFVGNSSTGRGGTRTN